MQAYLLQAESGKPRVAAPYRILRSVAWPQRGGSSTPLLYSTYSVVPANRLNRVGLQLSPDGEQAFIQKLFPFQNEGPGATNLLSSLD